jgi:hypothetical protein
MRAWATNSAGIAYGPDSTFTTLAEVPVLSVGSPTNVLITTCTLWTTISDLGGANPDSLALKFHKGADADSVVKVARAITAADTMSYQWTGRVLGTQYHYQIALHNSAGWGNYTVDATVTMNNVPTVANVSVFWTGLGDVWISGQVTALNGANADTLGVIFKAGSTPAVTDSTVKYARAMAAADTFSVHVTGIGGLTTYKYELFAHNAPGRGYGPEGTWPVTPVGIIRNGYTEITTEVKTIVTTEIK